MGCNANILENCFLKLKLEHSRFNSVALGEAIVTEHPSAGGLNWTIVCFPRGCKSSNGEYVSLAIGSQDKSRKAAMKVVFHVFVMGRDGTPSPSHAKGSIQVIITYKPDGTEPVMRFLDKFMKRSELESDYLIDGCITFLCVITILPDDRSISVPASDLGNHLDNLLDCTDGSDVSFLVGGETFRAHRAVLAARSPVFKAQLLGSMAVAKMDRITLHDIQPATFRALLRFIYTDALPADNVLDSCSSTIELLQHLLAAADMYHLDRLKLLCAQKLSDRVSVANVATMLGCAETHNCPELKGRCIEFFMVERNFKKVVLTEGYLRLMQRVDPLAVNNAFTEETDVPLTPRSVASKQAITITLKTATGTDTRALNTSILSCSGGELTAKVSPYRGTEEPFAHGLEKVTEKRRACQAAIMLDSCFTTFKLDYAGTKNLAVGAVICSDEISAGGHLWRLRCFPHGYSTDDHGAYLAFFLQLVSDSKNVKAIFDVALMGRDGLPSPMHTKRLMKEYSKASESWGFRCFMKRSILEQSSYLTDGYALLMFGVIVLPDNPRHNPVTVPPSDIRNHLGHLLDCTDGSDVSFSIAGETFHAHRSVLAARSPVFKAQLLGSMADANMSCITLHDIQPTTFKTLLRFIYTDTLPGDHEFGTSSSATIELLQNLLEAADMYHLERLKLVCAHKLWEHVSTDTVAAMLNFAELHNCPELKNACIDFFLVEENLKKAVLTEGYMRLMQSSPSIIDEIRERIGN
ncbi:hypothetical protein EJB05_48148, partial [Eragrostis curvula]